MMILMAGSVIFRAALTSHARVPADTNVTTGASGLISKSGGAVVTGTTVIAFVHGLMIEVIIFLGGTGFHEKKFIMAGLTIHPHLLTMVVMSEEHSLQWFSPNDRFLGREMTGTAI